MIKTYAEEECMEGSSHYMHPIEDKTEGSKLDGWTLGWTDSLTGTELDHLKSAGPIDWGTCQEVTKRDLDAIEGAVIAVGGPFKVDGMNTVSREHNDRNISAIDNERRSNPSHVEEQKNDSAG